MTPLVSVIIPVYNGATTLLQAVDSARQQSGCTVEVIICDDGSTDNTPDLLQRLLQEGVTCVAQRNQGPAAARNHALQYASGDYVACLDADDLWLPGKLAAQASALSESPEAAVAYGWTDITDLQGSFRHRDRRASFTGNVYARLLADNFIVSGSNSMMRRSAILEVGGFDESLRAVEDWELHVRLAARYPFACVSQVVTQYRKSPQSLSSDVRLMETSYLSAAAKIFATAPSRYRKLQGKNRAAFYRYLAMRCLQAGGNHRRALGYLGTALRSDPFSVLAVLRVINPRGALGLALQRRVCRE